MGNLGSLVKGFRLAGNLFTLIPAVVRNTLSLCSIIFVIQLTSACNHSDDPQLQAPELIVNQVQVDEIIVSASTAATGVSCQAPVMVIAFNAPVLTASLTSEAIRVTDASGKLVSITTSFLQDNTQLRVQVQGNLRDLSRYQLILQPPLSGAAGNAFQSITYTFYTASNDTPDFPTISDEVLLTLVQQRTFGYFWTLAHPASGMARERNTSGDVVTTGGTGFGLMAMIVAMERQFISRADGLDRLRKVLTFLEQADRFHGAWPHWLNGNTGKVIPFSTNDNGADLVETSFLMQGLIIMRQYLQANVAEEQQLIDRINTLWHGVEWNWFTRQQQVLYWHWSPDKAWIMNLPIRGWNEALMTYILAASSPDYAIEADVYHNGWAQGGAMVNGKNFYNIRLPLGQDYGGPLFLAHYSFLGLDPRNLKDRYATYWEQLVNHSRIHQAYAVDNPKRYIGYSASCWGLTASDNSTGYSAHAPLNDLGVVAPTAALSSFPYTPEASMNALKFFYYTLGDRLWGDYGFYDAFDLTKGWTADSYLAIDQGPIVVMIENYRSGLLWTLFMSAPEIQQGLKRLDFEY